MAERDPNLLPFAASRRVTAAAQPVPLQLHRRVHAELVARNNEGFLEGVCHALDTLSVLGFHEAYDAALAKLFVEAEGGHG